MPLRKRKLALVEEDDRVKPITPSQQSFIEALLSGKNIKDAASAAGISRRAATYWLADPQSQVCEEYEAQRGKQMQAFSERVSRLHELAFTAIEEYLSPGAPPAIRYMAAKFIYEQHLAQACYLRLPKEALSLAQEETALVSEHDYFDTWDTEKLKRIPT